MCDSMYAGAKKTACGYNIFAKSSDRSPNEPQPLIFVPAADHAQEKRLKRRSSKLNRFHTPMR